MLDFSLAVNGFYQILHIFSDYNIYNIIDLNIISGYIIFLK